MEKESKVIRYGDFITIRGFVQKKKNTNIFGFLSSPGFALTKVFFQSVPEDILKGEQQTQNNSNGDGKGLSIITNYYRDFIFQVWPKCASEAHKDCRKLMKQKQKLLELEIEKGDKLPPKEQQFLEDIKQKLVGLKVRQQQEIIINEQLLKSYKNTVVPYGSDIQLQHADSKMFLSGKMIASEAEKSGYMYELSKNYSGGMIFKFLPKFKLRQLGEPIQYIDTVILKNTKLNCFINFQNEYQTEIDRPLENKQKDLYITPQQRQLDNKTQRHESFLSLFSDVQFKIYKHSSYINEDETRIRGGQFIRLRHTELEAFLCADCTYESNNEELFLRKYFGEDVLEKQSISSIWEIESDNFNNRGQFLKSQDQDGNLINYRLRHFQTGKLLCIDDVNLKNVGKKTIYCLSNSLKEDPKTIINFITTKKGFMNNLEVDNCYNIGNKDGYLKLLNNVNFQFSDQNMNHIPDFFTRINEEEIQVTRVGTEHQKQKLDDHAFWIESVDQEEIEDMLFIQSCIPIMNKLVEIFKNKQTQLLSQDLLSLGVKTLTELVFFVLKNEDKDQNPLEVEGISIQKRQKLMRDMRFLEILTNLLYFPFINNIYDPKDMKKCPSDMRKIFQISYRLIKFSIMEYRPNEIYCSQWIELFMSQAMEFNSENDIMAEPTLTELIDNNEYVLEKKINEDAIKKFVDLLLVYKEVKYLNLLKALINCNNEAVIFNQRQIGLLLLDNEQNRENIIIPYKYNQNEIEIFVNDSYKKLSELGGYLCEHSDVLKTSFEYFVSLIELFSDLCLDRNFEAIDYMKKMYPFKVCYDIISGDQYSYIIRSAFTKLMITCWIDGQRLPKLDYPNYLRIWKEIPSHPTDQLLCYKGSIDLKDFNKLQEYIVQYLEEIVKYGYQNSFMVPNNTFTKQILILTETFLKYGLYTDSNQLQKLIIPLLSFLNGSLDCITEEQERNLHTLIKKKFKSSKLSQSQHPKNKQQVTAEPQKGQTAQSIYEIPLQDSQSSNINKYEYSEDNVILIDCRKIITKILKTVSILDLDNKATNFLIRFKRNYQDNDFHNQNIDEIHQSFMGEKKKSNKQLPVGKSPLSASLSSKEGLIGGQNYEMEQLNIDPTLINKDPLTWIRQISEQSQIDFENLSQADYNSILSNLFLYQDQDLQSQAFQLLETNFSSQQRLINYLKEVQIFEDAHKIRQLNSTSEIKNKLLDLSDTAEKWYGKNGQEESKTMQEFLACLDTLFMYIVSSKNQDKESENDSNIDNNFISTQKDDPYFSENIIKKYIQYDFQKLMKNLKIYEPLINMIKYDISMDKKQEEKENSTLLIRRIYKLLSLFAFQNNSNQVILEQYIDFIFKHLEKNYKSYAYMLIQEIYRNNAQILHDYTKVDNIIDQILPIINNLKHDDELKPMHMDCLKVLMKDHGQIIKQNQINMIQKLGAQKYNNVLMFIYNNPNTLKDFQESCQFIAKKTMESIDEPSQNNNIIFMPSLLEFLNSQLNIMSVTAEDTNASAESKCQTFFPLEELLKLVQISKGCWQIRKTLIFFFFHVYLETEKQIDDKDPSLIELVKELQQDLVEIASLYEKFNNESIQVRTFKGNLGLKQLMDQYIYKVLFEGVIQIVTKNLMYNKEGEKQFYEEICNAILTISKQTQIKYCKQCICKVFYTIGQKKHIANFLQYEKNIKPQLPNDYVHLLGKIEKKGFKQQNIDQVVIFQNKINVSQIIGQSAGDKYMWRIHKLAQSEQFDKLIEFEFENMVRVIGNIEQRSKLAFNQLNTIQFESIIKKLIQLLDPINQILPDEYNIKGLKIFRKIIEMQNKDKQTPASEWETDDYEEYAKLIEHKQDLLVEYGMVDVVCRMIAADVNKSIKNEAILLGNALCLGGNKKAQEAFYNFLENDTSNGVMLKLKDMINTSFNLIKKAMDRRNKLRFNLEFKKQEEDQDEDIVQEVSAVKQVMQDQTKSEQETDEVNDLKRIYRLLQLLCEGHYNDMQSFLRQQILNNHVSGKSINFIQNACLQFGVSLRFLNQDCLELLNQIIDFLIEALQGPCHENQQTLINSKVVEFVKELLVMFTKPSDYTRRGFETQEQKNEVDQLVFKSNSLLLALIEGNQDAQIAEFLNDQLDFKFIKGKLTEQFKQFVQNQLKLEPKKYGNYSIQQKLYSKVTVFEGYILEAFNTFLLIATLSDILKRYNIEEDKNQPLMCLDNLSNNEDHEEALMEDKAILFFKNNTANVEVYFKENLQRIFFPIHPTCKNLAKSTRVKFMNEVSRDSPNDKLGGLVASSGYMFTEMQHISWLKTLPFQFTSKRFDTLSNLSTLQAFLINIVLILVLYREVGDEYNTTEIVMDKKFLGAINSQVLIYVFGFVQLVLSITMMIFWFIINAPTIKRINWDVFVEANQGEKNEKMDAEIAEIKHPKYYTTGQIRYLMRTRGAYDSCFQIHGEMNLGCLFGYLYFWEKNFIMLFSNSSVLYMVFYIVCSLIGFFVDPLIYCFHLLDIMNRFPLLKNVILSVTKNFDQLALTFYLGLIIIYIYTIIGYHYLNADWYNGGITNDTGYGENMCTSLFQCFLWTIDYGLRNGGGISESLSISSYSEQNRNRYYIRFIYDVSFFTLVTVIFLNIIFGIIIDTFGGLRDEKVEKDQDMKSRCYICGLDRYIFEKNADGFENHIEKDHQAWNYLYYLFYIEQKDSNDYNGIESEVVEKLEIHDISWFPIMKAISVGENQEEDQEHKEQQIEQLQKLQGIKNSLQEVLDNLNEP